MSIVLVGSTSGSITLQEPAVAGTTVLDLPATSGTILTTGSSGQSIPKAALPTGSVLQVVNATYSTAATTTSGTFQDTGLTATITPTSASSKILVLVSHPQNFTNNLSDSGLALAINLCRNGSSLTAWSNFLGFGSTSNNFPSAGLVYWDSPATTSATTYKTQFCRNNGGTYQVGVQSSNTPSSLTLLEIAA